MFFVKGWRPLAEATRTVRLRRWREMGALKDAGQEVAVSKVMDDLDKDVAFEAWAICATAKRVGASRERACD